MEMIDQNNGIVGSTTGSNYYVWILSTINRELLKPSASVALHRHSNPLVDVLPPKADSSISLLSQSERPDVDYNMDVWRFCLQSAGIFQRQCLNMPPEWAGLGFWSRNEDPFFLAGEPVLASRLQVGENLRLCK